uniref:Uncharacterized protein n=1 Tax=Arundo donax TaxID=35708 RepID=A0A0A9A106_ARUDO
MRTTSSSRPCRRL